MGMWCIFQVSLEERYRQSYRLIQICVGVFYPTYGNVQQVPLEKRIPFTFAPFMFINYVFEGIVPFDSDKVVHG